MKQNTDRSWFNRFGLMGQTRAQARVPICTMFVALGLLLGALPLSAGVVKIELPPETASFKPAPGSEIANGQCLTCHSVDYVLTQPPEQRAFWAAEVKKMNKVYGAQIPEDQVESLADYLASNYGTGTNGQPSAASSASPKTVPNTAAATNAEAFAKKYGCLSCHGIKVKIVGPAFQDVAAKYRNDPAALDKISWQIHNGGSGKWGPVIMPPFPMVTDAQAKMVARWIMDQNAAGQ
jgi:cytochrome c551/c552